MPAPYTRPLFYTEEKNGNKKAENETIELLEKVINMLEENEKEIILLKQIASKLNDKLEDTKIIIK